MFEVDPGAYWSLFQLSFRRPFRVIVGVGKVTAPIRWAGQSRTLGMTATELARPETPAPPGKTRLRFFAAAFTGVLALAAALAVGHLVAGFISINASPYLAVGNGAIDLTPIELKDFAVRTFGTYDKLVLLGSMAVVMVGVAALAGVLSRRSPVPGTVLIAVFGLVGAFAVYQRPDLSAVALLAPVASLIAACRGFPSPAPDRAARVARPGDGREDRHVPAAVPDRRRGCRRGSPARPVSAGS